MSGTPCCLKQSAVGQTAGREDAVQYGSAIGGPAECCAHQEFVLCSSGLFIRLINPWGVLLLVTMSVGTWVTECVCAIVYTGLCCWHHDESIGGMGQVMEEGERLSKKQLAQESSIKKLRAQLKEQDLAKTELATSLTIERNKVHMRYFTPAI